MSRALSLASLRKDAVPSLWTRKAPPLDFGREQFRFRLDRKARKLPSIDLDPWVEHANWGRDGGKRTGEINFRRPLGKSAAAMVAKGDTIRCDVAVWGSGGGWRTLWKMEVATPNHQIVEGILSMALTVSLDPLTKSKLAWKFRKGKAKPRGWTAGEITRAACQRMGVKIRSLPKSTARIDKLVEKSASAYDVIVRAWKEERSETGRRFDVDLSTGELVVRELREPRYMLLLGDAIADATLEQAFGTYATAIVATASRKASGGKKARKLRTRVVDQARRRRHGTIVRTVKAPAKIDSIAELRKWARRRLARTYLPRKAIEFTHPGLPFVDRGDAVRIKLADADLHSLVFVTAVRHDLSAGSYTMQVSVTFSDPYADMRKARAKKKKAAAAARRRRKATAATTTTTKPKRAATRED